MADARVELEVLERGEALIEAVVVEQDSDLGANARGVHARIHSEHAHVPGICANEPEENANRRGFSRAVRSEITKYGAGGYFEREAVE